MANPSTLMSAFGASYDINAINSLAMKAGIKPLSPNDIKTMTPQQIKAYLKAGKITDREIGKVIRRNSRTFRRNARVATSENLKQAQLMHGTIRQALGEAGSLGAQAIAQNAISKQQGSVSAISQNTSGGTEEQSDQSEYSGNTSHGPVARYSKRGRRED